MILTSPWRHFTTEELMCRGASCCGGQMKMHSSFMDKIVILRRELGFAFPISSAYRCPDHNETVSSTGRKGPHTTGRAIDIGVSYGEAVELLEAAVKSGLFTGIGINQKGMGRFIHLDDIPDRKAIWTY